MDNVIVLNLKGCVSPQSYHNAGIACKYTTLRKLSLSPAYILSRVYKALRLCTTRPQRSDV